MTTKGIYEMMRKECVRRPAAEKVWEKVMCEMDVRKIWWNLRHFDSGVKRECDVCKVGVENCMHEFVECSELRGFFERMKEMVYRCWDEKEIKTRNWKELWLFGWRGKMCGHNVNLLNLVLSHARYAVKLRRNVAHFEGKIVSVWDLMVGTIKRDIRLLYIHMGKEEFSDFQQVLKMNPDFEDAKVSLKQTLLDQQRKIDRGY
ncbi:hypothetical protein F7725_019717 [Dissostichus mawsoni]|uniref:Reverse transcriptase zinc-binding domain-containing protein n=1 Tax=Dissostichus mawsoni TaxID=36200 RepID=A0A7J5YNZ8_DISMA|nr:hypothetical protein F7725_019717 [Dissostichus mawsoni]